MKPERIDFGLRRLKGWEREGPQGIRRRFQHHDWREALILVEIVLDLGERLEHFPELIVQGCRVTVSLPPEGESQLTEKDLEFARALDGFTNEEAEIEALWGEAPEESLH